jgi:hypothetical protein
MRNRTLVISAAITAAFTAAPALGEQDLNVGMTRTPNTKPAFIGTVRSIASGISNGGGAALAA